MSWRWIRLPIFRQNLAMRSATSGLGLRAWLVESSRACPSSPGTSGMSLSLKPCSRLAWSLFGRPQYADFQYRYDSTRSAQSKILPIWILAVIVNRDFISYWSLLSWVNNLYGNYENVPSHVSKVLLELTMGIGWMHDKLNQLNKANLIFVPRPQQWVQTQSPGFESKPPTSLKVSLMWSSTALLCTTIKYLDILFSTAIMWHQKTLWLLFFLSKLKYNIIVSYIMEWILYCCRANSFLAT